MARLVYLINTSKSLSTTIKRFIISVTQNYGPNPEYRFYLDGGAAPAFTPLTFSSGAYSAQIDGFAAGLYRVDYRDDDRGEIMLCKFRAYNSAPCLAPDPHYGFEYRVVLDRFLFLSYTQAVKASVDGYTTNKLTTGGSIKIAQWFDSELLGLGVTAPIDNVTYKNLAEDCTEIPFEEIYMEEIPLDPMEVEESHTDITAVGEDDGTINLVVTGGSGSRSYAWGDGPTTQNRSGLAPGIYTVTVTDLVTLEEVELSIEITEPQPEVVEGTKFEFPLLNSLHFVVDPVSPDQCANLQQLDNVMFKDQFFPGFTKTNYFQKFCLCDTPPIQFNSNFLNHTVEIVKCSDPTQVVLTIPVVLKEQNLGLTEDFPIVIRNHTVVGQSRVYFIAGNPPIPLEVGSVFEIMDNLDGFNGMYAVVNIAFDATLGVSYLIITKNYGIAAPSSNATGRFPNSVVDYNVYEFTINMSALAADKYHAIATAIGSDLDNKSIAISEPFDVQESHPKTNLLKFKCVDNAYDITWTTGFEPMIRVESLFFKRLPGGEKSSSRDSNFSLVNINAKKTRGMLFEVFALPPYLHEKLSTVFDCDTVTINGVEYRASEGWGEPEYRNKNLLAASSIKVEKVDWFRRYNSDDIGTVNEGGFIMTETGFLKR